MTCKKLSVHPTIARVRACILKHFILKTETRIKEHLDVWGLREKFSTFLPLARAVIGTDFIIPRFLRELGLIKQDCMECPLEQADEEHWRIPIHISSVALFQSAGPVLKYMEEISEKVSSIRRGTYYENSKPTGSRWSFPPLDLPPCTNDVGYGIDETPNEFRELVRKDYLAQFHYESEPPHRVEQDAIQFGFRMNLDDFLEGPLHNDLQETGYEGSWSEFIDDCASTKSLPRCHCLTYHYPIFSSPESHESFLRKRGGFKEEDLSQVNFVDLDNALVNTGFHFEFYYHNLSLPKRNFRFKRQPSLKAYVRDWFIYFRKQRLSRRNSPLTFTSPEEAVGEVLPSVMDKYKKGDPRGYQGKYIPLPEDREPGVLAFDGEMLYCSSPRDLWNYVKYVVARAKFPL